MTDPLPYQAILKRVPSQARSAERVETLLDAAAALLHERDPGDITVRDLAAAAAVPTGTLYQFFDDTDAVLQALALRYLAGSRATLEAALEPSDGDWPEVVDRVIDGYAAMIRVDPAIRRLWLSGTLGAATRRAGVDSDHDTAARLAAALRRRSGSRRGSPAQWLVLVTLANALLRHAFTLDPAGDALALREARRATRCYAAAILGQSQETMLATTMTSTVTAKAAATAQQA